MQFNTFGAIIIILNTILIYLLSKTRRIGLNRGAGISGWVSVLIGMLTLVFYKVSIFASMSTTIAFSIGIIAVLAIICIIVPALSPNMNANSFRHIDKACRYSGWFIGYIVGILVGVLI